MQDTGALPTQAEGTVASGKPWDQSTLPRRTILHPLGPKEGPHTTAGTSQAALYKAAIGEICPSDPRTAQPTEVSLYLGR